MSVIKFLINVFFLVLYDCLYYFCIYYIPINIFNTITFSLHKLKNIFQHSCILVQYTCSDNISEYIYKLFCISSISSTKEIVLYKSGQIYYMFIYHTNIEQTKQLINHVIQTVHLDNEIEFIVRIHTQSIEVNEQYCIFVITVLLLLVISRYRYFAYNTYEYLYCLVSLLFAINAFLLHFQMIKHNANLTNIECYYHHTTTITNIIIYLFFVYVTEVAIIIFNIRK